MAIYHLSVKAISRSSGRSATGAVAYRAGEKIVDERTGEIHDYTRKRGVESADIVLPDGAPEWAKNRSALWNAAELAERRKDACVAREFEVALPSELSPAERRRLALDFAKDMANREGCAVDVAIHSPAKDGDNRNHHAHILRTTRKVESDGLGAKLDTEKAGRKRSDDLEVVRERWADMTNARLRENGINASVDHRSLRAQGIEREPTKHLGPSASGYERRTGAPSDNRIRHEQYASDRLAAAKRIGELEREELSLQSGLIMLSSDIAAAKLQVAREAQPKKESYYSLANVAARAQSAAQAEKPRQLPSDSLKPAQPQQDRDAAYAAMVAEAKQKGITYDIKPGLPYVGLIKEISACGRFAIQDQGRGAVVIHDLAKLEGRFVRGQKAHITYRDGIGRDKLQGLVQERSRPGLSR